MNARKPATDGKGSLLRSTGAGPTAAKRVDPPAAKGTPPSDEAPESAHGGWAASTYELLTGAEVSDDPDTVPTALLDELFAAKKPPPADEGDPPKHRS